MFRYVQTTLPVDLWKRYKQAALDLGIPLTQVLQTALDRGIDELETDAYLATQHQRKKEKENG